LLTKGTELDSSNQPSSTGGAFGGGFYTQTGAVTSHFCSGFQRSVDTSNTWFQTFNVGTLLNYSVGFEAL